MSNQGSLDFLENLEPPRPAEAPPAMAGPAPGAPDINYEATPDIFVKIDVAEEGQPIKSKEGSLNPIRPIGHLKARLGRLLKLPPEKMEFQLEPTRGQDAKVMEDDKTLAFYEVETDDLITITVRHNNNQAS